MEDLIKIRGAKQHNLKNIDLDIPKNELVVFTGISGSGKSSLAFDTIYAEGQRRYVESLSSYARQFLGIMDKPDVETIEGLSPSISIDQKAAPHNPRSTVGTTTEIYDYLRLLYARIGHPHCPKCSKEIAKQSPQQITQAVQELIIKTAREDGIARTLVLSPVVRDRKGEFGSLFDNLKSKGYMRVRVDGKIINLDEDFVLIKTNKHSIDAIVDRISFSQKEAKDKVATSNLKTRLSNTVEQALEMSDGLLIASLVKDPSFDFPTKPKSTQDHLYSEKFACPDDNLSLPEIEPRSFSFNSPHGACQKCNGIGTLLTIDPELIVSPDLTISQGALLLFSSVTSKNTWFKRKIYTILEAYNESDDKPWKELPASLKNLILHGDPDRVFTIQGENRFGEPASFETAFEGIIQTLEDRYQESKSDSVRSEIEKYMRKETCPACDGKRLKKEALSVTIQDQNIISLTNKQINKNRSWVESVAAELSKRELVIADPILKELKMRLKFLSSVGLSYLTLDREAASLSSGEAQRIRLASQIGSGLTGVLYVLDEPTIGLHQRDNKRLIKTLKNLRNLGNSVIVVEHDRETIKSADTIIDFGPGAGKNGGQVIFKGSPADLKKQKKSLTGRYLSGSKKMTIKNKSKKNHNNQHLILEGCRQHNLKDITVKFPLGKFICITGVSGSGKSTLVHDILYHSLKREQNFLHKIKPGEHDSIKGVGAINRVSLIDQSPIGRTPRSNPATYTKAFDYIRRLFANTRESAVRGYKPGRFSFNVRGGRCEACNGAGQVKIEMQFLPDVYVACEVCHATRYNSETLEVRYRGKNISEVLDMTVDEAYDFFQHVAGLKKTLKTLQDVGLGYIELGQSAPTLSGGEAQRVKISKELAINRTGHTLYLLDEPTTGLHFEDLNKLLDVLSRLVQDDNTVIIIEHNLDVIKNVDYIIDLGPEGGDKGGHLVATGTPSQISKTTNSYTGKYLSRYIS